MFKKMFSKKASPKRTFKVTNVVNTDGCPTKFKPGRYTGNHVKAARKAFNNLCGRKKIRGKCVLYISVQETTRGSGKAVMMNNDDGKKSTIEKKEKHYKVERTKLKEPKVMMAGTENEYTILYQSVAKAVDSIPPCTKDRKRTVGRMKKTTYRSNKRKAELKSKKSKKNNNNNKKMLNTNLENNNNYANNRMNGGSRKSKSKGRKTGLRRSMKRNRK